MQALREKLLLEAEESLKDYAGLQGYWVSLHSCTVPQELYEEMKLQQAACNQVTNCALTILSIVRFQCSLSNAYERAPYA